MNILKVKSILFSLMAITMVTVFLTSCEKEQMVLEESFDSTEQIAQQENLPGLLISQNIAEGGDEAIQAYLEGISKEELTMHMNDYIIMKFFEDNNRLNEFSDDFLDVGTFQGQDLSEYLSSQQFDELNAQLNNFKDQELTLRGWYCYEVVILYNGTCYERIICIYI